MDILLHMVALTFLPIMAYILFLGIKDIFSEIRDQFSSGRITPPSRAIHLPIQSYYLVESNTPIS